MNPRYERPATLDAAIALLARPRGGDGLNGTGAAAPWALLAGGTDLYPAHVGRPMSRPLIDIGAIGSLRGITSEADAVTFGATTTWSDVLKADLPPRFDALKQAAREIGGVQIQNAGTLAGNLCNASPAADGTPVWMALDASVRLQSARGERSVPVAEFVLGSRRTVCAADEIVVAIEVPAPASTVASQRSVFLKLGGRRYLTISMTMIAVSLSLDGEHRVVHAGIAVGSCSAQALRLPSLEGRLIGHMADASLASRLDASDLDVLAPIDDLRASAAYRRDATRTLLTRALASLAT